LVLLIYAGDALVRGSISLARRLNLPPIVIGLTIIAFGTSAPELVVGIDAVLTKVPTLALGNVVGSNIANIWMVIGLPAIIAPMTCHAHRLSHNIVAMLLATIGFIAMAFTGEFTAIKGMVLLAGLLIFLIFSSRREKDGVSYQDILEDMEGVPKKPDSFRMSALIITLSLLGLAIGAHFFVAGAVNFARLMGVSEAMALRIESFDWYAATFRFVRPKTQVEAVLPLLGPAANALASYLRKGRPACGSAKRSRATFLQARAPYGPLSTKTLYKSLQRYAAAAGISTPCSPLRPRS